MFSRWFQIFFVFTPKIEEDEPILTNIFFRWVGSTTKQFVTEIPEFLKLWELTSQIYSPPPSQSPGHFFECVPMIFHRRSGGMCHVLDAFPVPWFFGSLLYSQVGEAIGK